MSAGLNEGRCFITGIFSMGSFNHFMIMFAAVLSFALSALVSRNVHFSRHFAPAEWVAWRGGKRHQNGFMRA